MPKLITILTFVTLGAGAAPANAQIYAWRDSHGNLVLSDRALDPTAVSFPVGNANVRTTTPVALYARDSYDDLIVRHATDNQIRPDLVRAVIQVESGYNRYAQSRKGAMGLMQLMPATATRLRVRDPYDPAQNIHGGVRYLRQLLDQYNNNEELALAAYNAGPNAVAQYGYAIPPYKETRNYVKRIKGITAVSRASLSRTVYKSFEIIDGRRIPRYSDTKPTSGDYEIVTSTR